jgi:hypothetical protein
MAHFAKVNPENIVVAVVVAEQEYIDTFIDSSPGKWIQTSINTRGGVHYDPETGQPSDDQSKALRKNFAAIGYTYDSVRDAFIAPNSYESWVLNEQTCIWEPPVPIPPTNKDVGAWVWDEETQNWI